MNKKYSIPVLLIGSLILIASPNDPPNGFTGAPGEGTCFSCHNPAGSQNGTVTVTGMPSVIEPNTTYMLTVTSTITSGTALVAGFQLTVLNSANQMAGTLSNPGPGSAIQTQSGRQYWEQNVPASYSGGVVTWTADWLSPTMPANTTITYYVANN